jgi:3-hydroxyacyl-CoA dehydrogenase
MTSNDSAATRHLSAAEIEARNVPGLSAEVRLRAIRKVGILGAGTMGGGIAMNFANVGIPTVVVEVAQDALDRGLGLVRRNYEASAAKGRMTSRDVEARMALLAGSLNYASLADCDLVIEAVPEDMELKQKVCARLGAITRPGAIIATNTSTLDVDVLAEATCKPADVVGLHFFSPESAISHSRKASSDVRVISSPLLRASDASRVPTIGAGASGNNLRTPAEVKDA